MRGHIVTETSRVHRKQILHDVKIRKTSNKKIRNEIINKGTMLVLTSFALFFFLFTILFIAFRGVNAFGDIDDLNWRYFFTGNYYSPNTGYLPGMLMIVNSIWTTLLTMIIAIPVSVMTALFITRVAPKWMRGTLFSIIALLAAVPSVIYGSFGSNIINDLAYSWSNTTGPLISIVFTLALMVIPTITLITITSINNVDKKMEMSSLALGATKSQTTRNVTLRAITSGILTGAILGIGRALGEASAVSMVAGESNYMPSVGLFENIRLITSTMLKGWGEVKGTDQEGYTFSLAMVLMISVLVVFFIMKFFVKQTDVKEIEKKQNKEKHKLRLLDKKVKSVGVSSLSKSDQYVWYNISEIRRHKKIQRTVERNRSSFYKSISNTTTTPFKDRYKKIKSFNFTAFSFVFSMVGVFSFIAIITYLFWGGIGYLNWEYISTKGFYEDIDGVRVNGLAIPLFGTLITMFTAFVFVIPLGLFGGIYFGEYSKDGRISRILISGIELLASIPSLIMGLIGFVLFIPIANLVNYAPLSGALILVFISLPTVIKTTEEAIKSVSKTRKEASLALGATKASSAWKIAVPEAMPGVLSGYILSAGRMLGESAALIIIWGSASAPSAGEWLTAGGTTLATEIYGLANNAPFIPWEVIKSIGIFIMAIILGLSIGANSIKEGRRNEAIIIFLSLTTIFFSIWFNILAIFIIAFTIFILTLSTTSFIFIHQIIENKWGINIIPIKVQYWYKTRIGK